jgi:two-component system, NarL family, nitrate/nitrite response regulator NarL
VHTSTVIVSPRVLLREGIASLLQNTRYKVVASAAGPAQLSPGCCPKGQSTLAIVGIDLQNGNLDEFAESIRLLRSLMPDGKVVLVADTAGRIDLQRALAFAADAFIVNLGSRDVLIKILELTFMDQRVLVLSDSMAKVASDSSAKTASNGHDVPNSAGGSPSSNSYQLGTNGRTSLSPRERQILISLAKGDSNKAIARLHNLSEATVKAHLKAILRKTKTQNRTQAAIWAIEQGCQDHFSDHSRDMLTDAASLAPVRQAALIQSAGSQQGFDVDSPMKRVDRPWS